MTLVDVQIALSGVRVPLTVEGEELLPYPL